MERIAVYESDDLMRALLREWLVDAGYAVNDASPTVEADPPFALAIVSIAVPKQSEVPIRAVRRRHPGVPIIALSSQARSGLSTRGSAAQALGVERLLAKPLTRTELLDAVEAVIGAANEQRRTMLDS